VFDIRTAKETCRVTHGGPVALVRVSPDDSVVVTVSEDDNMRVSSADTCSVVANLERRIGQSVYGAFSPDGGRLVVSDGSSDAAHVYDTKTWIELATLPQSGIVTSVSFTRDGSHVVTGGLIKDAYVWRMRFMAPRGGELVRSACGEKLRGARTLTADDVAAVPTLRGREGEDVCTGRSWWRISGR